MSDDFDDPQLGDALRRIAGSAPDADVAFGSFGHRVRVARIRRVSVVASSAAAVVLIGVGAAAFTGGGTGGKIPPRSGVTLDSVADSADVSGPTTGTTEPQPGPHDSGPGNASGPPATSGSGSEHTGGSTTGTGSGHSDDGSSTTESSSSSTESDGFSDGSDGPSDDTTATVESNSPATGGTVTKRCTSAGGAYNAVHSGTNSISDVVPTAGYYVDRREIDSESTTVVFRSGENEIHLVARWYGSSFTCAVES